MDVINKPPVSDDEEDLEALRLAALQTLKKNASSVQVSIGGQRVSNTGSRNDMEATFKTGTKGHGNFSSKRGRYYGGRGTKNGQFHSGRAISSNLISLTPSVLREDMKPKNLEQNIDDSTLLLPQDRYNNKMLQPKSDESSSKFDRYKDTDNSEDEDSEDEALKSESDDESLVKLERSNSLEALMQELDDEIQGRAKPTIEEKPVRIKSKMKRRKSEHIKAEVKEEKENEPKIEVEEKLEPEPPVEEKNIEAKSSDSPVNNSELIQAENEPQPKKRRHSSPLQREFRAYRGKPRQFKRSPPFLPAFSLNNPPLFANPPFGPPMINPPPFYERPLSPLHINAETLQTQTMAPLSPRSAAFVLENRAIIEKRKRSPRRSYSRSPSPRRRSTSPRRSLTPTRRRSMSPRKRSLSPRKRSLSPPLRKRSRSPKRRSVSPKRRSPSPKRRNFSPKLKPLSPKRRSISPRKRSLSPRRRDRKETTDNIKSKPSVRERLGIKSSSKPEEKDIKAQADLNAKKIEKVLDPVLEARKKKFEAKEIKIREGVIRLKPKDEVKPDIVEPEIPENAGKSTEITTEPVLTVEEPEQEPDKEIINEDALLEDDELDLDAQMDLFSDEESGSDNEGRFKVKKATVEKLMVLPFSKLVNGTKKEVKLPENEDKKLKARSRSPIQRIKEPVETKPPSDSILKTSHIKSRKKLGVKSERHPKKFERRIEIKIKNPSKYERTDDIEGENSKASKDRGVRKVELGNVVKRILTNIGDEEEDETEIVVENEDEIENDVNNEGDLRAQLSKKRAEKLQKITSHKGVTSRLLQNALQNALPIKKSKKSKSKELTSSELATIKSLFTADFIASRLQLTVRSQRHVTIYKNKSFKFGFKSRARPAEGKLPIHLRLGVACSSDVFAKTKRKSKKRKTVETEDQV